MIQPLGPTNLDCINSRPKQLDLKLALTLTQAEFPSSSSFKSSIFKFIGVNPNFNLMCYICFNGFNVFKVVHMYNLPKYK